MRSEHGLTRQTLRGVWPALVVPWTADDALDEDRFRDEVRAYAGTGVQGVYTGGTTGEFYAQDDGTFARVTAIACEEAHRIGLPVQIGCTALSTRTACRRVRTAVAAGADGVQIALPFWLELKDAEVLSFCDAVASAAGDVPLVLYHTPRAKRLLEPQLLGDLAARHPTLIGMKDTTATAARVRAVLERIPDFAVLGSELDLLERMQGGGRGACSSVALLNPSLVVELYAACAAGRIEEARHRQAAIRRYMTEALLPMVTEDGLHDSAVDRVQRVLGGVDVGLRCAAPYRSASPAHVERLRLWCHEHAPDMLARHVIGVESSSMKPNHQRISTV